MKSNQHEKHSADNGADNNSSVLSQEKVQVQAIPSVTNITHFHGPVSSPIHTGSGGIYEQQPKSSDTGRTETAPSLQSLRDDTVFRFGLIALILLLVVVGSVLFIQYSADPGISSTKQNRQPAIAAMARADAEPGANEYVLTGIETEAVALGNLLVVSAQDDTGLESDVAVVYVVASHVDNLVVRAIFQRPAVALADLTEVRVATALDQVNLERMVAVDATFVGFTLAQGRIRLNPKAQMRVNDELSAVELTANGGAIAISPPLVLQVESLSTNGEIADATVAGAAVWPPYGTLLIPHKSRKTFQIAVNGTLADSELCVRQGDRVHIVADGTISTMSAIGTIGPEGKVYFSLANGVQSPIDPIYDIVPEFPHGVLLFRIADPTLSATEGWQNYADTKTFTAERTGCLAFDINDRAKEDNRGAYAVEIVVNP